MFLIPFWPGESVFQISCRRQVLVLAHLNGGTGTQMQREHVTSTVAGERDLSGSTRLGQKQRHAGDHALERTLALDPDRQRRLFPQHHVVLEKHWDAAVQPDVQYRHQLSVDAVVHSRRAPSAMVVGSSWGGSAIYVTHRRPWRAAGCS